MTYFQSELHQSGAFAYPNHVQFNHRQCDANISKVKATAFWLITTQKQDFNGTFRLFSKKVKCFGTSFVILWYISFSKRLMNTWNVNTPLTCSIIGVTPTHCKHIHICTHSSLDDSFPHPHTSRRSPLEVIWNT